MRDREGRGGRFVLHTLSDFCCCLWLKPKPHIHQAHTHKLTHCHTHTRIHTLTHIQRLDTCSFCLSVVFIWICVLCSDQSTLWWTCLLKELLWINLISLHTHIVRTHHYTHTDTGSYANRSTAGELWMICFSNSVSVSEVCWNGWYCSLGQNWWEQCGSFMERSQKSVNIDTFNKNNKQAQGWKCIANNLICSLSKKQSQTSILTGLC